MWVPAELGRKWLSHPIKIVENSKMLLFHIGIKPKSFFSFLCVFVWKARKRKRPHNSAVVSVLMWDVKGFIKADLCSCSKAYVIIYMQWSRVPTKDFKRVTPEYTDRMGEDPGLSHCFEAGTKRTWTRSSPNKGKGPNHLAILGCFCFLWFWPLISSLTWDPLSSSKLVHSCKKFYFWWVNIFWRGKKK